MTVPVHGLPPLLREGLTVAVVPPQLRAERWHVVEACAHEGRAGSLVALSGVTDIAAAEELVGKTLLADVADLPADLALHDVDALLGREVTDERYGELGTIAEVMVGVANDVWVVEGRYGELLIPVIDEVIADAAGEGPLLVRIPDGIVPSGEG